MLELTTKSVADSPYRIPNAVFVAQDLAVLFPAYVAVDDAGLILSVGPSIRRLLPDTKVGAPFAVEFELESRGAARSVSDLTTPNTPIGLRSRRKNLSLAGIAVRQSGYLLFCVGYTPASLSAFEELALDFCDFSPADAGGAALTLVGLQKSLLDEAQTVAAELSEARDAALAETKAKAEFLANISHEIRTPLTAVIGCADLLEAQSNLLEPAKTYVRRIGAGGRSLMSLVDNVLSLARIDAGGIISKPNWISTRREIEDAIEVLRGEGERKGFSINLVLEMTVPECVHLDAARMREVLLNLLSNALKYSKGDTVEVRVSYTIDRGGILKVAVTNGAPGIPTELAERLFRRFSQLGARSQLTQSGVGLGLAICKGIVESLGGSIGFVSEEQSGSTFWFELPAPAGTGAATIGSKSDEITTSAKYKILLVDDVQTNLEVIGALLERYGHEIVTANSGEGALTLASQTAFDFILMDIQMPGLDGFTTAEVLRKSDGPNRTTPIIGVSADVTDANLNLLRRSGMNEYVAKPLDMRCLICKLNALHTNRTPGCKS